LIVLIVLGEEYKIIKLLIMHFSLTSYYFLPFGSKYSPQHPILKCLESMFSS
jgi:hypothetical protein